MGRKGGFRWLMSIMMALALLVTACSGDEGGGAGDDTATGEEDTESDGDTDAGDEADGSDDEAAELTEFTVLFPIDTPIVHGFRVAMEAGYYEDEGLAPDFQFLGGGGEVVTQLVGGNAEIGMTPVGNVVEAIGQGNTDLRALWNWVYGSIFFIAVPADSSIQSAEDLAGAKLGVSSLSGGEIPIVRGIIDSAGLTDQDVELTPIGEGAALAVQAIQNGDVDAFGGSINDMIALQVQGLDLRFILPDELTALPASGAVVRQDYLVDNRETIEGFLRASTKGFYWAQVNPDATLALLQEVTPEQFAEETGELIFEAVRPLTWSPEGTPMGFQSADTWRDFFEFIDAEQPDVPLDDIVIEDFIEAANDFDRTEVEADANNYAS